MAVMIQSLNAMVELFIIYSSCFRPYDDDSCIPRHNSSRFFLSGLQKINLNLEREYCQNSCFHPVSGLRARVRLAEQSLRPRVSFDSGEYKTFHNNATLWYLLSETAGFGTHFDCLC